MKLSNRPHLLNCESDRDDMMVNIEGVSLTQAQLVSFMSKPEAGCEVLQAFIQCLKIDDKAKNKKQRMFPLVRFPLEINLMFFIRI